MIHSQRLLVFAIPIMFLSASVARQASDNRQSSDKVEDGPLVRSLRLVHEYGNERAVDPENDNQVKGTLSKELGKSGILDGDKTRALMDPSTFEKIAGADGVIDLEDARRSLNAAMPESRKKLLPKVRAYVERLETEFDLIDSPHRIAGRKLADWIVERYKPGKSLHVIVICTGNTRRSVLGATLGNISASYEGMPEIRFHSGGTAPTAINARTLRTLKEVGVEIESTGKEARAANRKPRIRFYVFVGESRAIRPSRCSNSRRNTQTRPTRPRNSPRSWSAAKPTRNVQSSPEPRRGFPCPISIRKSMTTALMKRSNTPNVATTWDASCCPLSFRPNVASHPR